jgi:hypothetical protein
MSGFVIDNLPGLIYSGATAVVLMVGSVVLAGGVAFGAFLTGKALHRIHRP